MSTPSAIKGPGLFLSQFLSDEPPFNSLPAIASWAAGLGFKALQLPTNDARVFDLAKAAESQTYCDEVTGIAAEHGLVLSELSTHLQGQLIAVHPAYDDLFDAFAPVQYRGNPSARRAWAEQQLGLACRASARLGMKAHATFSGALAWPYVYPWPQRPSGLVEAAFDELASRWSPILDCFADAGVDLCYEVHPSEDLHDGDSFEMFLERVTSKEVCKILYDPSHLLLQQMDYLDYLDIYAEKIGMFHVKDAEFRPSGRNGVYGGYQDWGKRAGRFRSPGDGQVDFRAIFTKLTQIGFDGWAVLEWECFLKSPEQGAREGARFIASHLIEVTNKPFDDFAKVAADKSMFQRILGLENT